ncbi:hypothetical protein B5S31_g1175 [[Candida] boidinii]|uniref:Unnamed protein product n=1 Tax=Candida boidinii TaxID=5477 RepID=A0ACB5TES3_CANBO|nr:hypothetical protein B5S31_g1175 [[Candida] boidinii]GME87199.1 unnamed protein product [[Candida] boidinii]GMF07003.1 unnamed protein product [[Candida] boidinii]
MSALNKLKAYENSRKIDNALLQVKNRENEISQSDPTIYVDDNGNEFKTTERIVKDVVPLITEKPTDSKLFSRANGLPDYKFMREHFKREGKLQIHQVIRIIKMTTNLLSKESNLIHVPAPVTVCGDVHGQFYDLCKLFEICGDPDKSPFLFLGDYVDRGAYSIETLLLLYAMKLNHPDTFFLLRGNHESKQMTMHFTFHSECILKYSLDVYKESIESFKALPIAAIMNKQFFCVHGGISRELKKVSDLNRINRFVEDFPSSGLLCDLMWADPSADYDTEIFDEDDEYDPSSYFTENYERGCSFMFTYKASCKFLQENNLLCILRAHQAQDAGYRMYKKTESQQFPSVITLFSAPNYCGTYGNKAAVLRYEKAVMNIRQFSSSPVPYRLPNLIDVFTWSIPFVAERTADILLSVLNICTEDELKEDTPIARKLVESLNDVSSNPLSKSEIINRMADNEYIDNTPTTTTGTTAGTTVGTTTVATTTATATATSKGTDNSESDNGKSQAVLRNELRNKILAIGRVSRMFNILREEAEKVEHLRKLSGGELPKGVLISGKDELDNKITSFEEARLADLANEGLPPTPEEVKRKEDEKFRSLRKKIDSELRK